MALEFSLSILDTGTQILTHVHTHAMMLLISGNVENKPGQHNGISKCREMLKEESF